MAIHIVEQGECISSIAKKSGFKSWRTIYEHEKNQSFRIKRPNPNIIYPGDRLYIPDSKVSKTESGSTDQKHRFKQKGAEVRLTIHIAGFVGLSLEGHPYLLKFNDKEIQDTICGTGIIDHQIPVGLQEAELVISLKRDNNLNKGCRWILKIGHLDPISTVSGFQARFNNLGFYAGPVDGVMGPYTRTAIRQFQRMHNLVIDEIFGPRTKVKLEQVYGC